MGTVNKVVSIVILVLALGAAAMSFLLGKKREVLVTGWDKMAGCINQTATSLDAGSDTKYAQKLQKMNLSHTKFEDLDKVLPELPKQAEAVIMQRDSMAVAMKEIATTLELEGIAEADAMKSVNGYSTGKDKLLELVKKSQERNNGVIQGFVTSCNKIGVKASASELKDFEKYKDPVKNFDAKVTKINKRMTSYESHIGQLASAVGASSPTLGGDDFETSLKDTVTAAEALMNNFEQTKKDLMNEKDRTKTTEVKLEEREQKIVSLEKAVSTKGNEIDGLKKQISQLSGSGEGNKEDITILEDGDPRLLKYLKGKVVEMNDKWDFVVIDLGKHTKVKQQVGKREIDNVVMLPANEEMVVARDLGTDNQFVGKIKITKVYDNCAIANVLPNPKGSSAVKIGDTVYFSEDAITGILKSKEVKKVEEKKPEEDKAEPKKEEEKEEKTEESSSDDSSSEAAE
ncbi:MAG: hypothetical protein A2020_00150 [Lentisphaerae bacterium GWF2_45_14]|nr:MAG: hypothetical protein A2020_00150 [Lentisphaerae bacterium GWF2_45_14]